MFWSQYIILYSDFFAFAFDSSVYVVRVNQSYSEHSLWILLNWSESLREHIDAS